MTIGEKIKKVRKAKNLTQPALASLISKSVRMVQKYENDDVTPSIEQIEQIAIALGTTPFELMGADYWDVKHPEIKKQVDTIEGLLSLLTDIYGYAELKWVEGECASNCYYLVGEKEKQFILHEVDVNNLVELAKESIKPLVERIKDTRSEEEVVNEFLTDLNSQETKEWAESIEADLKNPEK